MTMDPWLALYPEPNFAVTDGPDAVSYCPDCGDWLFNDEHRGQVELWCRETKNQKSLENRELEFSSHRKRGRPPRKAVAPWEAAGISRASWYRRRNGHAVQR
jgi:hypothetical protein